MVASGNSTESTGDILPLTKLQTGNWISSDHISIHHTEGGRPTQPALAKEPDDIDFEGRGYYPPVWFAVQYVKPKVQSRS